MSASSQLLAFRVRGKWFACDLLWVREIVRRPFVTPVDRAPPVVRGLVHLRGQILTALDLNVRLGLEAGGPESAERCVVFKTAAELARLSPPPPDAGQAGADPVGLIVDEIGDILPRPENLLPPPPESLSGLSQDCIAGMLPRADDLVTVLRPGPVLAPPSKSEV